jgi:hypothetical protein
MTSSLRAASDRPWVDKDPAHWTLEDAELVLWQSPWAKVRTFGFFDRRGIQREARLCVRIQSALPMRLALAQAYQLQPEPDVVQAGTAAPETTEAVANQLHFEGELVFSLIIFPPFLQRRLDNQDLKRLQEVSWLLVDGRKIGLKTFIPPARSSFGEAWFRFPRPETRPGSTLKFVTAVQIPQRIKIQTEFRVEDLTFRKHPEY